MYSYFFGYPHVRIMIIWCVFVCVYLCLFFRDLGIKVEEVGNDIVVIIFWFLD